MHSVAPPAADVCTWDLAEQPKKNYLPPVNWRWVEEGDGYVGRLQPPGQPLGVGLPSGLQCLVPYPYRTSSHTASACGGSRTRTHASRQSVGCLKTAEPGVLACIWWLPYKQSAAAGVKPDLAAASIATLIPKSLMPAAVPKTLPAVCMAPSRCSKAFTFKSGCTAVLVQPVQ